MKKWGIIVSIAFLSLSGFIAYDYLRFFDGKLHVVFCNVGQGDAILLRTPKGKNILIDSGPDTSILACLSKNMPFWERKIHMLILSHPHEDHFFGMYYVMDRYIALGFDTEELINNTTEFKDFLDKIQMKRIPSKMLYSGDTLRVSDGVTISILSPTKDFLQSTSRGGIIPQKGELSSLIQQVSFGSFSLLLTGDSQAREMAQATASLAHGVDVIQVPHHGSKTGLSSTILKALHPVLAVISVGENNYGHPSKETLQLFADEKIKTLRTDQQGDIEIVSDGKNWNVKSN
jgi:competence protein ComEC